MSIKIDVKDASGKSVRKAELDDGIFSVEMNEHVLYLATKAYRANRRQGTHSVKTRSHVSGTGKKPFKQKGTGNARQGSLRGPHMPGGAVVHGPQPRSYRQKLNKKVKSLALKIALSDRAKAGTLHVVDDFSVSNYETKKMLSMLNSFGLKNVLLSDERKDTMLFRSSKNIHGVGVVPIGELNAEHVLKHENILISENALQVLTSRLQKEAE